MKDSVFEGVLLDLPIDATNVEIVVSYSYNIPSLGTHKASVRRFFPSKSQASFRREMSKVDDSIKKFDKEVRQAVELVKGVEDRLHKRLNKLERKNDSDTAGNSGPNVADPT